jgi:hypothetical protein
MHDMMRKERMQQKFVSQEIREDETWERLLEAEKKKEEKKRELKSLLDSNDR